MGKKTGCLSVSHRSSFGSIYFDKGRISYASIVNRRDRLGDMLVKNDVISQSQLDGAIEAQRHHPDRRLGELLVERGVLTGDQLQHFIRVQIEEAVFFLFTWTQGTFNFEADVLPDQQDVIVSINPESLLLEGARRVDEWGLVENKIPSFDIVFEIDRTRVLSSEATLTTEQRAVMELVDGIRDVQGIVDASGLVEFEVGKALYGLVTAGFVNRIGTTSPAGISEQGSDSRIEEHRNLGIAFYRTGMLEEAFREFRRVLDLRSGDGPALGYLGLVLARQGLWAEAASAFAEAATRPDAAYSVYHNLAYALERNGRLIEARVALEEALRRGGDVDPRVSVSVGVVALLSGDLAAAETALAGARATTGADGPSASWFHFSALVAGLRGDLTAAMALLSTGVAAHPRSAVLANNLAVVLERRGLFDEARQCIEHGIHEDNALPQLQKNLGDLHYRAGRYDEALEAYSRATKIRPDLGGDVYLKLGNIRLRRDEREAAVRSWERALELEPHNEIARGNLDSLRQGI
ncbi:MAG TPA: DUF4388 domain-containing protein, partial [Gemmatimonadaceae bacterium]|nr:DUF4388 domain-containing protein [Gemmatimonadaceae bacterium]